MYPQDTPDERWLPVAEFPQYMISTRGRVWGRFRKRIRAVMLRKNGYQYISIWDGQRIIKRNVHRLVAHAFLGPCPEDHQVDHIDNNRSNNSLGNLQYVTCVQNQRLSWERTPDRVGPQGSTNGQSILTTDQVLAIRAVPQSRGICITLAKQYDVSHVAIRDIRNRRRWRHLP